MIMFDFLKLIFIVCIYKRFRDFWVFVFIECIFFFVYYLNNNDFSFVFRVSDQKNDNLIYVCLFVFMVLSYVLLN